LERRFTRSDLQKSVVEEQADSLRLLIVVGGHGAFVATFGNRAVCDANGLDLLQRRWHGEDVILCAFDVMGQLSAVSSGDRSRDGSSIH
jgi:hypothetical protein